MQTRFVNEGIKYNDLSAEEREQLEQVWEYEQLNKDPDDQWEPRDISEQEIYKYIYNTDTIDKMLQDLMENGLKIHSGEMIGKSIIFAMNSKTAKLIVERFNILYPEYGSDFCQQIDYSIKYSQDLIDKFSLRDSFPQIAVSVDMLDTGIDVPDVLNLVFFKRVRSRIKFLQMIGRGTRLSPGIFGAQAGGLLSSQAGGLRSDKGVFYIFDWGGNFEYFGENPKEGKAVKSLSLTERLFGVRAAIQNIEQLTSADIDELERILWQELGTKEEYERYLRRESMTTDIPVAAFIRKVSGLDRQKAIRLFSDFISANTLTAEQEEFINNILNYVCQNGDMEKNVFVNNRIFRESLLKYFPNKAAQVARFVAMLHDTITVA